MSSLNRKQDFVEREVIGATGTLQKVEEEFLKFLFASPHAQRSLCLSLCRTLESID